CGALVALRAFATRRSSDLGRRKSGTGYGNDACPAPVLGFAQVAWRSRATPQEDDVRAQAVMDGRKGRTYGTRPLPRTATDFSSRSEEHTSELQSRDKLECR